MSTGVTGLALTNVRCFSGEQRARLARITLLVGENSVGKTTFLGCLNALGRLAGFAGLRDGINWFDQDPFSMGSFETLARTGAPSFRAGIGLADGPVSELMIQFAAGADMDLREVELELRLADSASETASTLTMRRGPVPTHPEHWRFDGPGFQFLLPQSEVSYRQFTTWLSQAVRYGLLPFAGDQTQFRKRVHRATDRDVAAFIKCVNFFRHRLRLPDAPLRVIPIQPHGLEPRRLYSSHPLGGADAQADFGAINDLGRRLGIFDGIEVRQSGRKDFEVRVDVSGASRNLQDVGYGVASVLPALKAMASAPGSSVFLLQQPEVHLHPTAQAALVGMMARSDHAFVVETHSDHVLDWFRILAKEGTLLPSDVAIIYFESAPDDPTETRLHQISLDSRANMSGQPRGYRRFFSTETARLLGFPA